LSAHDLERLARLKLLASLHGVGWAALSSLLVARIYVTIPVAWNVSLLGVAGALTAASALGYLTLRPAARRLVWSR
jgi:hypothetical protein